MNLIAAVDKNWGIGNKGRLLVSIPEDMKLFRDETYGKVVVMGRKTFESLPSKAALAERKNIVLTRDMKFKRQDAVVCHSLDEVLEEIGKYDSRDVYVIGGGDIYEMLLPYCDTAHITKIDYKYEADTHFPNLDAKDEWRITAKSEEHTYFDICYEFIRYERIR